MSIIFYHNEEQKALAYETKDKMEKELKSKVYTEIRPAAPFYMAEDYHQKYYLQQFRELKMALRGNFSTFQEFVAATITARTNGFVAGYGPWQELVNIIRPLDNHEAIIQILNQHKIRA
jgi:peptide-methionine (S)-S-oxide reductase